MRETTRLRGYFVNFDQAIQRAQNRSDRFNGIRRGIHSDHGVSASVKQPFKRGEQNSSNIIDWMVWLAADTEHSPLAHRIPASRDVPNFRRSEDQILIAHNLGQCRRDFGNDRVLDRFQLCLAGRVVEDVFAKLANGFALDRLECFLIERLKNQAADFIIGGINQRPLDNLGEGKVGKLAFGRNSLALRSRRDACQLVTRLLLIGFGKQLAEIGEDKSLMHGS